MCIRDSIGRVLGCSQKGGGAMEGKDYVVTWAMGHLVTLQDPEDYDKKYKEWKLEVCLLYTSRCV